MPKGWDGRWKWERGPRGRGYIYAHICVYVNIYGCMYFHFIVQQKLTQHCKATIPLKFKQQKTYDKHKGRSEMFWKPRQRMFPREVSEGAQEVTF